MYHAIVGQNKLPLATFQLSDKSEQCYDLMHKIMNEHLDELGITWRDGILVHADYEIGLRNSIKNGIPGSTIVGCTFHWSQALNRRADMNMKNLRIGKGKDSKKFCKWLDAVRTLPLSEFCKISNFKQLFQFPEMKLNGCG